ncbi:isochorismatase [Candidatus Fermentibacteria bacterium]|nr:MAG: isochorismatase [Candidatus Fermentibacteria bacterium]
MLKENYRSRMDLTGLCDEADVKLEVPGTVLLVLDMQDFFVSPDSHAFVPSAPELVPVIQLLVKEFKHRGLPVIYTRHLNTHSNAQMMGRWWRDVLTADNPLSRIHTGFNTSDSSVIEKTQYDAFYGTELNNLLEQLETTTVVITGVMTNLCCETTARSAFVRGYRVIMPVDGTVTMNMELHKATTANLSHGFSKQMRVSSIFAGLKESDEH